MPLGRMGRGECSQLSEVWPSCIPLPINSFSMRMKMEQEVVPWVFPWFKRKKKDFLVGLKKKCRQPVVAM